MRSWIRSVRFLLLLVLVACVFDARSQDDPIRVETGLVLVPLSVLDREGRYVANLKKDDFRVYENGSEQMIELFEPTYSKLSVILLLDVSGSMIFDMRQLASAASEFALSLRVEDSVMVAAFSDRIVSVAPLSTVKEFRKRSPMRLKVDGLPPITMVYDAMDFALKKAAKLPGRKAIVVLTDGIGDGIWSSIGDNYKLAEEGEALIYPIAFDTNVPQPVQGESSGRFKQRMKNAATAVDYLQNLAAKTGGRFHQIENVPDLAKTFAQIVAELNQQYTLGYYHVNEGQNGERRKIKVQVNVPNVSVRSRSDVVYKKAKR